MRRLCLTPKCKLTKAFLGTQHVEPGDWVIEATHCVKTPGEPAYVKLFAVEDDKMAEREMRSSIKNLSIKKIPEAGILWLSNLSKLTFTE